MRRSAQVAAPLLASAALGLMTGCRQPPEMQRCVDEHNVVVADSFCKNLPTASQQQRPGMPLILPYRYYYGGYGGYGLGSLAGGGGFSSVGGHSYSTSGGVSSGHASGTTRGGFGSSFGGGAHGSGGE